MQRESENLARMLHDNDEPDLVKLKATVSPVAWVMKLILDIGERSEYEGGPF